MIKRNGKSHAKLLNLLIDIHFTNTINQI